MTKVTAFHGTDKLFSEFDVNRARVSNDFWGGPIYFTSSVGVAKQYASAMAKRNKNNDKVMYTVSLDLKKTFDEDGTYTGKELARLAGPNFEQFARSAGLLRVGADKYSTLSLLEKGDMILTGKQVFLGLSNGMQNTAKARTALVRAGYDSLRYNGDVQMSMAEKHDVYLPYKSNQIKILKRELLN